MLLRILHGGNRASGGRCGSPEAWGDRADAVSVTHPAGSLGRKAAEQRSSPIELDGRLAVLARRSVFHGPSKQHSHQLGSVADAEDWYPGLEDGGVADGGGSCIDARRTPRKDDRLRVSSGQCLERRVEGDDLAEDVEFTDPACDELGVLTAEVQDQNKFVLGGSVHSGL